MSNSAKIVIKSLSCSDVYHFPLANYGIHKPVNYLKTIRAATNGRFKINVSFGFILKHRATEELRFFHPSNNTLLFETSMLVANETDFTSLLDRMEREDALEYARQQRPSTNWTVERVICVRFDVYRLMTNI